MARSTVKPGGEYDTGADQLLERRFVNRVVSVVCFIQQPEVSFQPALFEVPNQGHRDRRVGTAWLNQFPANHPPTLWRSCQSIEHLFLVLLNTSAGTHNPKLGMQNGFEQGSVSAVLCQKGAPVQSSDWLQQMIRRTPLQNLVPAKGPNNDDQAYDQRGRSLAGLVGE